MTSINLLLNRRSVIANKLGDPGPSAEERDQILQAAVRVPDHKVMAPWRFILFEGTARTAFGDLLAEAYRAGTSEPRLEQEAVEAARFLRAPLVIAAISRITDTSVVPEWEQILSAGAACQNILHAATALGYAGQWITEWYAYDPVVRDGLGLEPSERVAGFIYIGTATEVPKPRRRPTIEEVVSQWRPRSVDELSGVAEPTITE